MFGIGLSEVAKDAGEADVKKAYRKERPPIGRTFEGGLANEACDSLPQFPATSYLEYQHQPCLANV